MAQPLASDLTTAYGSAAAAVEHSAVKAPVECLIVTGKLLAS
jgi:hypothetical protein